jgi:hypothetical protein
LVRRILHLVELHQVREQLLEKTELHQKNMKDIFDKIAKDDVFQEGDLVLKWDAYIQDKGKNGKFDTLWIGPFIITQVL